jgi:hypothetical protein
MVFSCGFAWDCTNSGVLLYNLNGFECLLKAHFGRFVQIGGLNCTFSGV